MSRARSITMGTVGALSVGVTACHPRPPLPIDTVDVRLMGKGSNWVASYLVPSACVSSKSKPFAAGVTEVPTGHELHVPLGAEVKLALTSEDYICRFALKAYGLRDFAAPGLPSDFHFRAERAGSFDLLGEELCGLPHGDDSRGRLVVEEPAKYRDWVNARSMEGVK